MVICCMAILFNPLFYGENKVVTSSRVFNCTEFGINKVGVKQGFPFPNIFNEEWYQTPFKQRPAKVGKAKNGICYLLESLLEGKGNGVMKGERKGL